MKKSRGVVKKVRGVFEKVTGSGVWWIQYFDAAGRRRREKVGAKSSACELAESRRTKAREGIKMPENLRAKAVTFADLVEPALAYSRKHKPRSVGHHLLRMPRLLERFGTRPAESITPGEIREWLDSHAAWAVTTCNRYLALLKLVYRVAEENGKIKTNPTRLVRQSKEDNTRLRYLKDSEEPRLREAIMKLHPYRIPEFEIALQTGMRLSEQFTLTWDDVDLDAGLIYLSKTKSGSSRHVRLNSRALATMRMLQGQSIGEGRVFPVRRPDWFRECVREAGFKDFSWHTLRHTFASPLAMAGVGLRTVQELMGHKTISMTARYAHLSSEHSAAALEKLCQPTATSSATEASAAKSLVAPLVH